MNNNADRKPALRFSQRIGKKPIKCDFQLESMDDNLRNGLWNIVWEVAVGRIQYRGCSDVDDDWRPFLTSLWHSFFKWPVDEIPWHSYEPEPVNGFFTLVNILSFLFLPSIFARRPLRKN